MLNNRYKRIASARDDMELRELQVEMIDRFGLLPPATKNLFRLMELKIRAAALGIRRIETGRQGGRIHFEEKPRINPGIVIQLIQSKPNHYKLDGQSRLRFLQELPEGEDRISAVEKLLEILGQKDAA